MNHEVSAYKKTIGPWIPFGFCVALSAIVMVIWITMGKLDAAYPAFFCFLPMTFYFAALAMSQTKKDLQILSARIDQLEKEKK